MKRMLIAVIAALVLSAQVLASTAACVSACCAPAAEKSPGPQQMATMMHQGHHAGMMHTPPDQSAHTETSHTFACCFVSNVTLTSLATKPVTVGLPSVDTKGNASIFKPETHLRAIRTLPEISPPFRTGATPLLI